PLDLRPRLAPSSHVRRACLGLSALSHWPAPLVHVGSDRLPSHTNGATRMASKSRPCQRCNQMIPLGRLEALPETRLCLKCSQEVGGDFDRTVVVRRHKAKPGSFKPGSTEVDVVKRRKRIEPLDG